MDNNQSKRAYSLRKSRHIMLWVYSWYKKKAQTLPLIQLSALENDMQSLDQALIQRQKEPASEVAHRLETFAEIHCKKSLFTYAWEIVLALIFALVIATIVRQMWFEPFEIPTGSMRPTFKEQDHLVVTKTAFGINVPLDTSHFYFDPSLVERGGIVIWSGDGIPLPDTTSTYFGLFPYAKRYIKRNIGKPGDSLYFYGGRIYGVDLEGNDLSELRDAPWMQPLEYIPFLSFEGNILQGNDRTAFQRSMTLRQMHEPAGRVSYTQAGFIQGEVFDGKGWVKDQPMAQATSHDHIETYSDLLGIRNFAMARLLTKGELQQFPEGAQDLEEGVLYLQLHHTPSLNFPKPMIYREGVGIPGYTTVIPLQQHHLDALMDTLYTSRFIVSGGKATLYSVQGSHFGPDSPNFAGVADGTYEFYHGKASRIGWGGIESDVPSDSPLYNRDPASIQKLFNLGIQMSTIFSPQVRYPTLFPNRYAYFRDGDLFVMGAPIIKKDDSTLKAFHAREDKRQAQATTKVPYVAFKDYGPPMKEGKIDADFIRTFGVTVPSKHYLVLGDNHARSGDSREFGFVPEANLQGAPCWIVWPPGDRLGAPPQTPYPFMNIPRAVVWSIAAIIGLCWYIYYRRSLRKPIFIKKA